jgi:hypothetical protein
MNHIAMKGTEAVVTWGYYQAASLGSWTLSWEGATGSLTGTVKQSDAFRVTQQPLTFVVQRPNCQWTWPVESLQIVDTQLSAVVRPQE